MTDLQLLIQNELNFEPEKGKENKYKNFKVYIIRNIINDKVYVGSTCNSILERFIEHMYHIKGKSKENYRFNKIIKEIGSQNFYVQLIEKYECKNKHEMLYREGYYILLYNSNNSEYGYNTYLPKSKKIIKQFIPDNPKDKDTFIKEYCKLNNTILNFENYLQPKYGNIYRIFNINNNESYIGSTNLCIFSRLSGHIKTFKKNKNSEKLQNAFNKYGLDTFDIELLEIKLTDQENDLLELENIYVKKYDSINNGYNTLEVRLKRMDDNKSKINSKNCYCQGSYVPRKRSEHFRSLSHIAFVWTCTADLDLLREFELLKTKCTNDYNKELTNFNARYVKCTICNIPLSFKSKTQHITTQTHIGLMYDMA